MFGSTSRIGYRNWWGFCTEYCLLFPPKIGGRLEGKRGKGGIGRIPKLGVSLQLSRELVVNSLIADRDCSKKSQPDALYLTHTFYDLLVQ